MNKIPVLVFFISINVGLSAQEYSNVIPAVKKACELIVDSLRSDKKSIVNNGMLDEFFAKKTAYYITGSGDLSYSKNYATLNTADGEMFLGVNFTKESQTDFIGYVDSLMNVTGLLYLDGSRIINTQKSTQVKDVFTVGLLANTKDDFTKIFSKNSLVSELGVQIPIKVCTCTDLNCAASPV